MKFCEVTVRRIICLFILATISLLNASAASTDEMRAALIRLVNSQNLDQHWPAILRNARMDGMNKVRQGAMDSIAANPGLSAAQRAHAREIIDEMAPKIAAEVDALHEKLDVRALTLGMVEAVYPKYFSLAEIEGLAAFYGSSAFQKTVSISQMVAEESKRTGQAPALVWTRYSARLTEQERNFVMQFQNSPLGRKQRELGPTISREGIEYLNARLANEFNSAIAPFQEQFMKKLKDDQPK